MRQEIIIAGAGGQGIVFMGEVLVWAGLAAKKQISLMISYGPETRGGTVNCMIIISDETIRSPFVENPDVLLAMNQPSLTRFEKRVKAGGILMLNTSLTSDWPRRSDLNIYGVPANDAAETLSSPDAANMIMLGAYIKASGVLDWRSIAKGLKMLLAQKGHQNLIKPNKTALAQGAKVMTGGIPDMSGALSTIKIQGPASS